ncbi:MAG: acyltransferase family protein [Alphaproteobacteria bacterium]
MELQKLGFLKNTQTLHGEEIKSLTALRFFAALYVSLFHVHNFSGIDLGVLNTFLSNGYLAVDFFFILSGFILAYTYAPSYIDQTFSYKKFMIKRIARIYPVHLVCLFLMVGIYAISNAAGYQLDRHPGGLYNFTLNIFMLHSWGLNNHLTYNEPSWSISAEFFAYIMFPVCMLCSLRFKPSISLMIGGGLLLLVYFTLFLGLGINLNEYNPRTSLIRVIIEFFIGVSLFLFFKTYKLNKQTSNCIVVFIVALLFLLLNKGLDVFCIPVFAALIYLYAEQQRQGCASFFDSAIFNYLGRISYSFYMIHYVVWVGFLHVFLGNYMELMSADLTSSQILIYLCITTILFFPAAMLMHHCVELPARKWIVKKSLNSDIIN